MDNDRFDTWLRTLEDGISRRGMLGLIGGLGLAAAPTVAGAKRGKRRTRRATQARAANDLSAASKSVPAGQGRYQTLAAKWWAWAIDEDLAPVDDQTGAQCTDGQQGNTWFLAGSDFGAGPIVRTCAVPKGTKLFFPVINGTVFAPPAQAGCPLVPVHTTQQLAERRECLAEFFDTVDPSLLTAKVDGKPVPIVRATSALYPLHLDDDNPYKEFGATAGTYLEAADGFWVLLDPLSPGSHTIKFTASLDGVTTLIDVTYKLTVA